MNLEWPEFNFEVQHRLHGGVLPPVFRAGPAKLNSPMRVETAPEGEDIARENWSKDEQKTPPHALSGIQGQGGAGRRSRRQDAGRAGAAA